MEYPYGHHHHRRDEDDFPPPPPRHDHHHHHHHENEFPQPPPPDYRDQSPYPAEIVGHRHENPLPQPNQPEFGYPPPGYSSVHHVSHEYQGFEPNQSEFRHETHHHHQPDRYQPQPEVPTFVQHHSHEGGASGLFNRPTVRVICKAETEYSLTIRDGQVVLARYNPQDVFQHWIKDEKFSISVKDEEGFPSFSLVNKGTGQAIKHSIGTHHPVQLRHYNPNELDESVLWSESRDLGDGFRAVRMVNNIRLNLDAFRGESGIHDGSNVGVWEWKKGDNQRWRIVPYCKSLISFNK